MDFKLIVLFGGFLMANAGPQNQDYKNPRRTKSIRTASNSNMGIIRVKNPSSFTTAVPVTTYRPRSSLNYIRSSTPASTFTENYQTLNYQSENYEPQKYQSQNYQSSEVRPIVESYQFENNPSSEINYVTERNYLKGINYEQPERDNLMKKLLASEIVNAEYGPGLSKSGYTIVPDASPDSGNVNPNDYLGPIYNSNSLPSRGFSNSNKITQKPLVKIAYSPANEVAHVTFSGRNGQVYYSW